jgi:hypothetical protein
MLRFADRIVPSLPKGHPLSHPSQAQAKLFQFTISVLHALRFHQQLKRVLQAIPL